MSDKTVRGHFAAQQKAQVVRHRVAGKDAVPDPALERQPRRLVEREQRGR